MISRRRFARRRRRARRRRNTSLGALAPTPALAMRFRGGRPSSASARCRSKRRRRSRSRTIARRSSRATRHSANRWRRRRRNSTTFAPRRSRRRRGGTRAELPRDQQTRRDALLGGRRGPRAETRTSRPCAGGAAPTCGRGGGRPRTRRASGGREGLRVRNHRERRGVAAREREGNWNCARELSPTLRGKNESAAPFGVLVCDASTDAGSVAGFSDIASVMSEMPGNPTIQPPRPGAAKAGEQDQV